MLTGPKGRRCIDLDTDAARRDPASMMRTMDKKPADPQWREDELVLRQPIASRQLLFPDFDERTPRGGGNDRKPRGDVRRQHGGLRIGFEAPLLVAGLESRYGFGELVEQCKDRAGRVRPANPGEKTPHRTHKSAPHL